ncbi:hypothetical protein TrLO_g6849 [Triparma laevis f. longispina]|nr:hypothetical protein TrLO_g6849 [Triparma laevis f. longispina]
MTTLNYKEGISKFCGETRTDRGYIVPCYEFYVDLKSGIEGYNSFLKEGEAFDGGFTDWLGDGGVGRRFYIEKSEVYVRAEKEGWNEAELLTNLQEIKDRLGFSYNFKVKEGTNHLWDSLSETLKYGHTQEIQKHFPLQPIFEALTPPSEIPIQTTSTDEEPFCVIVPGRSATDCITFEKGGKPDVLVDEFCRDRTEKVWRTEYDLHVTYEDCYDKIYPELKKKILAGVYLVNVDEEINLRIDRNDPALFFNRLNRIGRVEPTTWGGAGRGAEGIIPNYHWEVNLPSTSTGVGEVTFIQVGAHVGRTRFDPIFPYAYKYGWSGLLVEPVRENYVELVKNYYNPNATSFKSESEPLNPFTVGFENAAVCDFNGEADFEFVDPKSDEITGSAEYFYKGMGVSARGRLVEQNLNAPKEEYYGMKIATTSVRCITFPTLLKKHGITNFKVLQIDAEGADLDVIKSVDFNRYTPMLVHYEHTGLSIDEQYEALDHLHANGYICELSTSADTACARVIASSFLNDYINSRTNEDPLDLVYLSKQVNLSIIYDAMCAVRHGASYEPSKCEPHKSIMMNSNTQSSSKPITIELVLDSQDVSITLPSSSHPSVIATAFCQGQIMSAWDCKVLSEEIYERWCASIFEEFWGRIL